MQESKTNQDKNMTQDRTEDLESEVPLEVIRTVEASVLNKLPVGIRIISVAAHGISHRARTSQIKAELDGSPQRYFLKVCEGERGRGIVRGEFIAMKTMHTTMPEFVPIPIAYGRYASNSHFFLASFHEMSDELPVPRVFSAKLAELHRKSVSPNGKFGFAVTTYHGDTPLDHGWADTWEEYFVTRTKALLLLETQSQGPNEECELLWKPFFTKVVPRLLRPMEIGGRVVKPSLLHGDLWHGNAGVDKDTGLPVIFDAACFYAHNECDLGVWREPWNKIGEPYVTEYHKHHPISPPEEDYEDRSALYNIRVNILDSILYKDDSSYRTRFITAAKRLVEKYPEGFEGWEKTRKNHEC